MVHFRLKMKHLVLYNLAFSGKLLDKESSHVTCHCIIELTRIPHRGILAAQPGGVCRDEGVYTRWGVYR